MECAVQPKSLVLYGHAVNSPSSDISLAQVHDHDTLNVDGG
jgi:hypothetical protein